MGQPVLSREKELRSAVALGDKTIRIADLSPEEQAEWARKYGLDLNKINDRTSQPAEDAQPETPKKLTRELYLELKEKRVNDKDIAKMFGMGYPTEIGSWKADNGLKNFRLNPDTRRSAVINERTDVRFKKEKIEVSGQPSETKSDIQSATNYQTIQNLEEELAKKDEQIKKYEALLIEANQARRVVEARVESLEVELLQYRRTKTLDLRVIIVDLMHTGMATVETFDQFQIVIAVLDKMKIPWTASHDTDKYRIETTP